MHVGLRSRSACFLAEANCWSDMLGMLGVHQEIAEYVRDDKRLEELPNDCYVFRQTCRSLTFGVRPKLAENSPLGCFGLGIAVSRRLGES